jgi:Xaa-Pro dipeptidase
LLGTSALVGATPPPAEDATLPAPIRALTDRRGEARPISLAERESRIARAQQLMRSSASGPAGANPGSKSGGKSGMDAIVLAGGTSLAYFTGIEWDISERLLACVIPQSGSLFFVAPVFEEGRVRELFAQVPGGASARIYTWNEDASPFALLGTALREHNLASGTLGMDEHMPFVFADEIAKACPALHITSATPVTAGCRMIKSPAELALMHLANNVTLSVYEAAWRSGHPGITTAAFLNLIAAGYARAGFPGEASCQTGIYSALPHGSVEPQVIREGAVVLIDDGCVVEGYHSDISRSFVYGRPTDKMVQVFDIVHKAQAAALAAAHPGKPCESVDAAARSVITSAGFGPDYRTFTHRLGHGIGMDGHEWPYLVRGNKLPLAPSMTFSDEPGIYLPGEFGIRLEDDMILTPDGATLFTPQSPSLTEPFAS